jgi:hypothetical protein
MRINIIALFVCLDDFCKLYEKVSSCNLLGYKEQRQRQGLLSLSEMLFIEVLYHFSPFKDFKRFYVYGISKEYRSFFNEIPTYERFVALKKKLFLPLSVLVHSLCGQETGLYFADSTPLKVCHNKRIHRHKVFEGLAERGATSMGWFYGFKLHLIVNHKGELMGVRITTGNTDDRAALKDMVKDLKGKIYADKGYIGNNIFNELWKKGLQLITGIRKNMKNYLMPLHDKIMLKKRFIIETIFGVLKTDFNLEYTRHRNPINAFVNILACLTAYIYKSNKPAIRAFLLHP